MMTSKATPIEDIVLGIQERLYYLSLYNDNITRVNPDGIFSEKTEEAVISFQHFYGLEESEMLSSPAFIELPLGDGDVPFENYLKALNGIGFEGYLTIEREVGADPKADIIKAADFLRKYIG